MISLDFLFSLDIRSHKSNFQNLIESEGVRDTLICTHTDDEIFHKHPQEAPVGPDETLPAVLGFQPFSQTEKIPDAIERDLCFFFMFCLSTKEKPSVHHTRFYKIIPKRSKLVSMTSE